MKKWQLNHNHLWVVLVSLPRAVFLPFFYLLFAPYCRDISWLYALDILFFLLMLWIVGLPKFIRPKRDIRLEIVIYAFFHFLFTYTIVFHFTIGCWA
ncbi:hypothetical protein [Entomospira culicis]|uniref:Uncharacterized protein n=1 Tax=Entomospira culicis TaxID=2719989 RepID=A0A968GFZ4_9SPIO|nr:hypothetical protein [Entomospira culicis]NIZ19498.1 hypothetical protein [Entomospira culicis]NIZ69597.1 hypothetical protein [Entomospira culicis]WDI36708.1 hypothetical protein PVA46_05125 [Entomospira culicis]WDI38337.1 hypothetical protein PVA47_05135 [Entomospira culicis]